MGNEESFPVLEPDRTSLNLRGERCNKIPFKIPEENRLETVDLSENFILELPKSMKALQSLNLSSNRLTSIHSKLPITAYTSLTYLNLSSNSLCEIPSEFAVLHNLKTLNVSGNRLKSLSIHIESLTFLDASCNHLTTFSLPSDSLTSLRLGFNRLSSISFSSSTIKELSLPGNNLVSLSSSFPNLQTLDVSFNRLTSMDNLSSMSPSICTISASNNFLTNIPQLPVSLSSINLSFNKLVSLPSLTGMRFLRQLLINDNLLEMIPELPFSIEVLHLEHNKIYAFSCSGSFQTLAISHNRLSEIPMICRSCITTINASCNSIQTIEFLSLPQAVVRIDLAENLLRTVPAGLFSLSRLKCLILADNNIKSLPSEIANSNLSTLSVCHNPISELPNLPQSISVVNGSNCEFSTFPPLSHLPKLIAVNFSNNSIVSIPFLPKVQSILLSCNKLTAFPNLPDSIVEIDVAHNLISNAGIPGTKRNLSELDLSFNPLVKFEYGVLPSLRTLKVANTDLSGSVKFDMLPSLASIDISETGLQLISIPESICELDTSNSVWFRQLSTPVLRLFNTEKAGYSEMRGVRETMEDAIIIRRAFDDVDIYAVLDGHAGDRAATLGAYFIPEFITKKKEFCLNSISEAVFKFNELLLANHVMDGSTISIVMRKGGHLLGCNLGDSRHLIVKRDGSVLPLTFDQRPTERSEMESVRERGSFVSDGRVAGVLAVSRALGDFQIPGISAVPSMTEYFVGPEDYRLVIACDGVFDTVTNEDVGIFATMDANPSAAAYRIRNIAFARMSQDNISVVVVDL